MNSSRAALALALILSAASPRLAAERYLFSTLAGNAGYGSGDGVGAAAGFSSPRGVAVDANGYLYVADTYNNTIRKITPAGYVTTLAGSAGESGSGDGTGAAARFSQPEALAVDAAGNVFVADTANNTIRRVTPTGVVTTVAGAGGFFGAGSTDGTGSAARFRRPQGIAVDVAGNVFVADTGNSTIRKISPSGVVTTFAGQADPVFLSGGSADGTGSAARFLEPRGIALDASGNLFVADTGNNTIRKITSAGVVTTVAGTPGALGFANGTGAAARFAQPRALTVDTSGNLFVADAFNTIRLITPAGVVTTFAGDFTGPGTADGIGTAARFSAPFGLATDPAGNIFVGEANSSVIRKITPAAVVTTFAGRAGSRDGGSIDGAGSVALFGRPSAVAAEPGGTVYVADTANHTIRKIAPTGVVTTLAGTAGASGTADGAGAAARFYEPAGVAVDAAGTVYVADTRNHSIRKISAGGVVSTFAGLSGTSGSDDGTGNAARFNWPRQLALDPSGNLYVADSANQTIRRITPAGVVTTLAGTAGVSGSADGTGAAARFNEPTAVAVDGSLNVWVGDSRNGTIRRISPAGVVTTVAGTPGTFGTSDGVRAAARFRSCRALVAAPGDVLLVADGNTIRRVTADGSVTTIAGAADASGYADGVGSAALFNEPYGLALDGNRRLYVADFFNNAIRIGRPVSDAPSQLANLSVRSAAGTGADTLIVGFNLAGAGSAPLLIRGVGPALATFGVTGVLIDPTLRLDVLNGALVAQNDNWDAGGATAAATIAGAATAVAAFPFAAGSRDAALLPTLNPGAYTAQIGGGAGVALVEVYDVNASPGIRLTNVSARTRSGTGGEILIAGFAIVGDGPKTLLIRGVGPALTQFGVTGVLADPQLQLFSGASLTAENDDWTGLATLAAAFTQTGAFALAPSSKDAALLVTLPPGSYTAQVGGVRGATGVALIEVYEVP